MVAMNFLANFFDDAIDKDICIIGKGRSVDQIDKKVLENCYIINVNDSHKVYQGHVSIMPERFYDPDSLPAKSILVSSVKTDRPRSLFVDDFHEDAVDNYLVDSMLGGELKMFDASFLSALHLASTIVLEGAQKNNIFMLGFDFEFKSGYSQTSNINATPGDADYADVMLHRHEKKFVNAKSFYSLHGVNITHVGSKPYSLYNAAAFNTVYAFRAIAEGYSHNINIDAFSAMPDTSSIDHSFSIVAEITTNHFGDTDRLLAMIYSAKKSGATHIKLQKRDVLTFYSSEKLSEPYESPFGKTFKDYRLGLELSDQQFELVDDFCSRIGIKWFASVLDITSYEYLKKFRLERIKLPSTISEHKELLAHVAGDYDGEVVISTGLTDAGYEKFIVDLFSNCKTLFLLQCTSSYPCALEDTHIGIVRHYSKLSTQYDFIKAGYSSHDIGAFASQLAIAAGAVMVEKHVKMGSVGWAHFDDVAVDLSTDDFANFVSQLKLAKSVVKDEIKTIKTTEHHKYWKN
jgi:N-acetylneuraminate synthase